MPDPFTLLLEWRRNEASGRGLSKLPPDFLASTTTYLTELKRSYEADLRENPSGRKGEISRQTYQRASQVARDIVEGRVQKILSLAFQASIGGTKEVPNALAEERAAFDRILSTLLEYRHTTAPYLEPVGTAGPTTAAASPSPPAARSAERPASPLPPPAVPGPPAPGARTSSPFAYVRIVKDGRPVEVGSETIELRAGDLLSLPPAFAKLLVDAQVAEMLEVIPPPPG